MMNQTSAKLANFWSLLTQYFTLDKFIEQIARKMVTGQKSNAVLRAKKNLSLITNLPKDDPQNALILEGVYQNLLYNYLEFFKICLAGSEKFKLCIDLDRTVIRQIYSALGKGQGVIFAGLHTYGYDIGMRAMNEYLPSIQIIGKPNPEKGEKLMHWLRKINRVSVTPLSFSSLRNAVARLTSGGIVAIAIDLPVKSCEKFDFFERDALLTNAHTRLAVQTGAKIFLFFSHRVGKSKYCIEIQEVLPPENFQQKKDLISSWAQKSYQQVEPLILCWPESWYGMTFELFSPDQSSQV